MEKGVLNILSLLNFNFFIDISMLLHDYLTSIVICPL